MSAFGSLIKLATSKQGRALLTQAQRAAQDPANRKRFLEARDRFLDPDGEAARKQKPAPAADATPDDAGERAAG